MATPDALMGFAARARKLVSGSNTCEMTAKGRRLKLLIIAEDISQGSRDKFIGIAGSYGVPFRIFGRGEELSKTVGTEGRYVFGITDRQFAGSIMREIDASKDGHDEDKEVFGWGSK